MKKKLASLLGVSTAVCAALPMTAAAQDTGIVSDVDIPGRPSAILGVGFQDLSGDGTTIAGAARFDATTYKAYRITLDGYEELPGIEGNAYVLAYGVSDDGSVIVGFSAPTYSSRGNAVVWEGTTLTALGHLATVAASQNSIAYGVSGDGKVIVGASTTNTGGLHAVSWTDKGAPVDLNGAAFTGSSARKASRDGSVIVGEAHSEALTNEAFVWTAAKGMVGLGVLEEDVSTTYAGSFATDVSADGLVVVGFSKGRPNDKSEAFRWTDAGGMVGLGVLADGTTSRALGTNADGSVIVGFADQPSAFVPGIFNTTAIRWTEAGGMQTVSNWLTANGVNVGENTFTDAVAVSDDGTVIIGTGQINGNTQEYIARVVSTNGGGDTGGSDTGGGDTGGGDSAGGDTGGGDTGGGDTGGGGSGVIGLSDYLGSLAGGGGVTYQNVFNAASLVLNGAHHRPLLDYAGEGKTCGWLTGDYAGSNRNGRRNVSGEAGICHDLVPGVRIGFGGGADGLDLDGPQGGKSEADGYHLVGEIDVQPQGLPLIFSLTGYYADWNVSLTRAYQNGANVDVSTAETDAMAWAVRGRIDWRDMVRLGQGVGLSGFAAFSHLHVKMDGYTETGGAFPLALNALKSSSDEMRLGAVLGADLTEKVRLRLSGEWVHRFDPTAAPLTGTILGVGVFAVSGPVPEGDWGRAGLDLDLGLNSHTMLSLSGHAMAGHGEDARLGGAVSVRFAF